MFFVTETRERAQEGRAPVSDVGSHRQDGGAVRPGASDMDEVAETLDFFVFSHKRSSAYTGIVTFVLTTPDQREHCRSVHVLPGGSVRVYPMHHPDTNCVVRMTRDAFLDVYNGHMHPKQAVLGGHLRIDGFRYAELSRYLTNAFHEWLTSY